MQRSSYLGFSLGISFFIRFLLTSLTYIFCKYVFKIELDKQILNASYKECENDFEKFLFLTSVQFYPRCTAECLRSKCNLSRDRIKMSFTWYPPQKQCFCLLFLVTMLWHSENENYLIKFRYCNFGNHVVFSQYLNCKNRTKYR